MRLFLPRSPWPAGFRIQVLLSAILIDPTCMKTPRVMPESGDSGQSTTTRDIKKQYRNSKNKAERKRKNKVKEYIGGICEALYGKDSDKMMMEVLHGALDFVTHNKSLLDEKDRRISELEQQLLILSAGMQPSNGPTNLSGGLNVLMTAGVSIQVSGAQQSTLSVGCSPIPYLVSQAEISRGPTSTPLQSRGAPSDAESASRNFSSDCPARDSTPRMSVHADASLASPSVVPSPMQEGVTVEDPVKVTVQTRSKPVFANMIPPYCLVRNLDVSANPVDSSLRLNFMNGVDDFVLSVADTGTVPGTDLVSGISPDVVLPTPSGTDPNLKHFLIPDPVVQHQIQQLVRFAALDNCDVKALSVPTNGMTSTDCGLALRNYTIDQLLTSPCPSIIHSGHGSVSFNPSFGEVQRAGCRPILGDIRAAAPLKVQRRPGFPAVGSQPGGIQSNHSLKRAGSSLAQGRQDPPTSKTAGPRPTSDASSVFSAEALIASPTPFSVYPVGSLGSLATAVTSNQTVGNKLEASGLAGSLPSVFVSSFSAESLLSPLFNTRALQHTGRAASTSGVHMRTNQGEQTQHSYRGNQSSGTGLGSAVLSLTPELTNTQGTPMTELRSTGAMFFSQASQNLLLSDVGGLGFSKASQDTPGLYSVDALISRSHQGTEKAADFTVPRLLMKPLQVSDGAQVPSHSNSLTPRHLQTTVGTRSPCRSLNLGPNYTQGVL